MLAFPGGSAVKSLPIMQEKQDWALGWEDPLEKEMTTSILLGKCCEQRSLPSYSPWGGKQLDMTATQQQQQKLLQGNSFTKQKQPKT